MCYGEGWGGVFNLRNMVLNFGGLLVCILIKYSSGYIIESGIFNLFM